MWQWIHYDEAVALTMQHMQDPTVAMTIASPLEGKRKFHEAEV